MLVLSVKEIMSKSFLEHSYFFDEALQLKEDWRGGSMRETKTIKAELRQQKEYLFCIFWL
jgi:hypothetical protein